MGRGNPEPLPKAGKCPPHPGHRQKEAAAAPAPVRGLRPPHPREGTYLPNKGGNTPNSARRGKPHFPNRSSTGSPGGRYLTDRLLERALARARPGPGPKRHAPGKSVRSAGDAPAAPAAGLQGPPEPRGPSPAAGRRETPTRPASAPAASPSPASCSPFLHPPSPHCGASFTCPRTHSAAAPAPSSGHPASRPRAGRPPAPQPPSCSPGRAAPAPAPSFYLVGIGGQEDVELGLCRSIHLGPESGGRA